MPTISGSPSLLARQGRLGPEPIGEVMDSLVRKDTPKIKNSE